MSDANPAVPCGQFAPSLTDLLDEVEALTEREDHPSLHNVMGAFGPAGAQPLMMVVALVTFSPLSGIPLSSLGGLTGCGCRAGLAAGRSRPTGCRRPWPGCGRQRVFSTGTAIRGCGS